MIWTIIAAILLLDAAIILAALWGVAAFCWSPLAKAFPSAPVDDNAVRKSLQSFRINLVNLGFSVHVAADEKHLHLEPAAVIRWFGGRRMSIPWESIEIEKRSKLGPWITARAGKWKLVGPSWCLDLAEPAAPPDDDAP